MAVESILVQGRSAWLKAYGAGERRVLRLRALDALARLLRIRALRPPPHVGGAEARRIEARRLAELESLGMHVPQVWGESASALVLSDLGQTLAQRLRDAGEDAVRVDALTTSVIAAIARAHRDGAYFGQLLPRNIAIDDEGVVGFLDFEEDPLDVMSLRDAQTRDWLLFAFGMTRYYEQRPQVLAELIADALRDAPRDVGEQAAQAGRQLDRIARSVRWMGRVARPLVTSVVVLQSVASLLSLAVLVMLVDWWPDRQLDLLQLMF